MENFSLVLKFIKSLLILLSGRNKFSADECVEFLFFVITGYNANQMITNFKVIGSKIIQK